MYRNGQVKFKWKMSDKITRKLEKQKGLCYNIFGSIYTEILKHQEQDKEAEQKPINYKNQKLSTGGNRQ